MNSLSVGVSAIISASLTCEFHSAVLIAFVGDFLMIGGGFLSLFLGFAVA